MNTKSFEDTYKEMITESRITRAIAGAAIGASTLMNPSITQAEVRAPHSVAVASIDHSVIESIKKDLIKHEGSITYQKYSGSFKNNRFYPYTDTTGHSTIGYGHKILPNESFSNGISITEAEKLLDQDLKIALDAATRLFAKHNVNPPNGLYRPIVNMIFQMGPTGVNKFSNMWKALREKNYNTAANEILASKYGRTDSPKRAKEVSNLVKSIN